MKIYFLYFQLGKAVFPLFQNLHAESAKCTVQVKAPFQTNRFRYDEFEIDNAVHPRSFQQYLFHLIHDSRSDEEFLKNLPGET